MKTVRWLTSLGCIMLLGSAILHSSGYIQLVHRIEASGIQFSLAGILKAFWWILAVYFMTLAVIAFLASRRGRGGGIVLWCAASAGVSTLLLFCFLGGFPGAYLLAVVTVLFLIGGRLQSKQNPPPSSSSFSS